MSPRLAWIIEESYFTLNGWRFRDLKNHIDLRVGKEPSHPLTLDHSCREIIEGDLNPERIALVTNLPPDETGIATCSLYSWIGHSGPVDIFCPASDIDWFFSNGLRLRNASKGAIRVLDVDVFLTADQMNQYKCIIVCAGNSNHCTYIHEVLRKASAFGKLDRFVFHVHDPCLLNLIQRGVMLTPAELISSFEAIYERELPVNKSDLASEGAVCAALVRSGVLGLRYFLNMGIKQYLVNSRTAFDLVIKDLSSPSAQVTQIFHPAFLPAGATEVVAVSAARSRVKPRELLTVGTFGIPSPSKLTHRVIAAAQEIRRRGTHVRLLIAGFEVRQYVLAHAGELAGLDLRTFDGPTDLQLLRCMAEVDVAVQFRAQNLGESSGIVPQLLCLGKSTLVSDVGSFREYGSAVKTISNDAGLSELAVCILGLWQNPIPQQILSEYVELHSSVRFRHKFMEAIGNNRSGTG